MRDPKVILAIAVCVLVVFAVATTVVGREITAHEISVKIKEGKRITPDDLRAVMENPSDYSNEELQYVVKKTADGQ